jgi:hypothetical protein
MLQLAPGDVLALHVAVAPAETGEVTDIILICKLALSLNEIGGEVVEAPGGCDSSEAEQPEKTSAPKSKKDVNQ